MEELVDRGLIPMILKLDLPLRLICDGTKAYPMKYRSKRGANSYIVALELGDRDIRKFKRTEIELKGRIDIEYLKYRGEVDLKPVPNEPGYYIMENVRLYKYNQRFYKRVPYRRLINIIDPINLEATLINFSASGALIHSREKIEGDKFKFSILLNKKDILLESRIIEQTYNESLEIFEIRCHFENVDEKTRKLLILTVREIILQAKRRLQQI